MTAGTAILPIVGVERAHAAPAPRRGAAVGRGMPVDNDWRFFRGEGQGLERPDADDAAWRRIDLPHDWSVEDVPGGAAPNQIGPFDRNAVGRVATGFTVGGEGWYRKHFRVDAYPADSRIEVVFGGA